MVGATMVADFVGRVYIQYLKCREVFARRSPHFLLVAVAANDRWTSEARKQKIEIQNMASRRRNKEEKLTQKKCDLDVCREKLEHAQEQASLFCFHLFSFFSFFFCISSTGFAKAGMSQGENGRSPHSRNRRKTGKRSIAIGK